MIRTTLSPEKQLAKHYFAKTHQDTPVAQTIQEYLQEVHGINVPKNFGAQLTLAHREFHGSPFNMRLSLVDTVVQACQYWREYVEDLDALVCNELLSMSRIHTSVVWQRSLIADGVALKKQPPFYFETIVTNDGKLIVRK